MDINQQSEQYIKFLTNQFLASLSAQVNHHVLQNITAEIDKLNIADQVEIQIKQSVASAIAQYVPVGMGPSLLAEFKTASQPHLDALAVEIKQQALQEFKSKLNSSDLQATIKGHVESYLEQSLKTNTWTFLPQSIPAAAIKTNEIKLSADNIEPGIIKKFSSSGIEDLSTECQVTITDQFTILENKLVAHDLEVRGAINLDPNLNLSWVGGIADLAVKKIEQTYSDGTFDQYVHRVFSKITTEGINSSVVMVQNKPIVESNALNPGITLSNLRKLGLLIELEVDGETLLDNTLYVRSGKIGVNTTEPQYTLDFWDQEVQIIATKRERDAAFFGTVKPQKLVIGTNTRDQLVLLPNGDIEVESITVGKVRHASAAWQPTDNRQLGTIVWNEQPKIGDPIGWVSLGGARWARFGIITE